MLSGDESRFLIADVVLVDVRVIVVKVWHDLVVAVPVLGMVAEVGTAAGRAVVAANQNKESDRDKR